jgi:hypothetical protein
MHMGIDMLFVIAQSAVVGLNQIVYSIIQTPRTLSSDETVLSVPHPFPFSRLNPTPSLSINHHLVSCPKPRGLGSTDRPKLKDKRKADVYRPCAGPITSWS